MKRICKIRKIVVDNTKRKTTSYGISIPRKFVEKYKLLGKKYIYIKFLGFLILRKVTK
ncbi:hypothetical protein KAI04_04010 [Candidatus Pacearchaeota archaeon]|nr:hypothetical protein [Candidatus Pacearchaeota archaeon]